jgi:hypothetical protein
MAVRPLTRKVSPPDVMTTYWKALAAVMVPVAISVPLPAMLPLATWAPLAA